jgi:hypothetical protein
MDVFFSLRPIANDLMFDNYVIELIVFIPYYSVLYDMHCDQWAFSFLRSWLRSSGNVYYQKIIAHRVFQ